MGPGLQPRTRTTRPDNCSMHRRVAAISASAPNSLLPYPVTKSGTQQLGSGRGRGRSHVTSRPRRGEEWCLPGRGHRSSDAARASPAVVGREISSAWRETAEARLDSGLRGSTACRRGWCLHNSLYPSRRVYPDGRDAFRPVSSCTEVKVRFRVSHC